MPRPTIHWGRSWPFRGPAIWHLQASRKRCACGPDYAGSTYSNLILAMLHAPEFDTPAAGGGRASQLECPPCETAGAIRPSREARARRQSAATARRLCLARFFRSRRRTQPHPAVSPSRSRGGASVRVCRWRAPRSSDARFSAVFRPLARYFRPTRSRCRRIDSR